MNSKDIKEILKKQGLTQDNKIYCVKCKTFLSIEERENICDLECLRGECKKKISQLVPSYKKCYTVYQYDRKKYSQIFKRLQQIAIKQNDARIFHRVSPYKVLDLCYIRGEDGKPKNIWFEDKVHRRKALDRITSTIAREVLLKYNNEPTEGDLRELFINTGLAVYIRQDYIQAEIFDLTTATTGERLHNHFLLLKFLKCGCTVEEAMHYVGLVMYKDGNIKKRDYSEYVNQVTFLDKEADEVGNEAPPKIYKTMSDLRGNMYLLDFFRDMTDKHTAFFKKDIKKEFCETFDCSTNFFDNRTDDILEEVAEQAALVGLKLFCDARLLYVAFEPYDAKFMESFKSDKRLGLV